MPVELITVQDLFGKNFIIPYYQRGYRWEFREVEDLLKDILEFQQKLNKQSGEFYCLQPIVVKKSVESENQYELIDGQQRLTTIYLLLKYFQDLIKIIYDTLENPDKWFKLEYKTRDNNLQYFLNGLIKQNNHGQTILQQNNQIQIIDFLYIQNAWDIINNWIDEGAKNQTLNKVEFLNTILKKDFRNDTQRDVANNIRFIWYEVNENENGQEIFTRINRGKIPLTNAELIKALFFIKKSAQTQDDKKNHQFKMAYEWELIENKLNDDGLWYFLNKEENKLPTRIDFIFNLIAEKYKNKVQIKVNKSIDKYFPFYIINELVSKKINISGENNLDDEDKVKEMLWDKVKEYFRLFEEWYNDYEYYHFIGYLIHTKNTNIEKIVDDYAGKSKDNFKSNLIDSIRNPF